MTFSKARMIGAIICLTLIHMPVASNKKPTHFGEVWNLKPREGEVKKDGMLGHLMRIIRDSISGSKEKFTTGYVFESNTARNVICNGKRFRLFLVTYLASLNIKTCGSDEATGMQIQDITIQDYADKAIPNVKESDITHANANIDGSTQNGADVEFSWKVDGRKDGDNKSGNINCCWCINMRAKTTGENPDPKEVAASQVTFDCLDTEICGFCSCGVNLQEKEVTGLCGWECRFDERNHLSKADIKNYKDYKHAFEMKVTLASDSDTLELIFDAASTIEKMSNLPDFTKIPIGKADGWAIEDIEAHMLSTLDEAAAETAEEAAEETAEEAVTEE